MEEEFVWTTKDGRGILLSEIEDVHLCNIERMMCREMDAAGRVSLMLQGEIALDAINMEIDGMEHDHDIICAEIRRRGLQWVRSPKIC